MNITPIKENESVGFHYTVSDEQLEIRSKMTDEEILNWVEETAQFIYEAQTPEERERMRKIKGVKW
jgi:predicted transposase YbfD/YdcC